MVGFAVIGLGMGRTRSRLITQTPDADLKVVVDLNSELACEVGKELDCDWTTSLEEAVERQDVDVVMMMTPSGLHAKLGLEVTAAGKHLISTKPMDVSTAACDELIRAADAAGVLLGIDYECRYVDNNLRVAEALRKGWFGSPILGEARFKWNRSQTYYDHGGGWRGTWSMDGGGSLANQGAHLLDLLLWFMGDSISVYAETSIMTHDIETEDIGLAIINFASGAKGTIMGTTTFPANEYYSIEVHGSEAGVLISEALTGQMRTVDGDDELEARLDSVDNGLHNVVEDAVRSVQSGCPLRVDGVEGRRTVALLEDIYRSARTGERVECTHLGG